MSDLDIAAAVVRLANRRCVYCGSDDRCQADHVRSRHAGGETIPVNLAPLCLPHNKFKSCFWPGHGYHPFDGWDDIEQAYAILDAEIMWLREHHDEAEIDEHIWRWYGEQC